MTESALYPWLEQPLVRLLAKREALAHAYLLAGHSGLGKTVFAEQFARALLCNAPAPMACGQCQSCQLFAAGTHPDLHVLQSERQTQECPDILAIYAGRYLEENKKRKKPSRVIAVDQVRSVLPDINARPHMAGCRIVILNPAEELNINAANSLLKALEEPPADTYFLLISHDPGRLLPTLRSRCNRIDFRPPEPAVALAWLAGQLVDPAQAEALLWRARGIPLRALALASTDDKEQVIADQMLALAQGRSDPVAVAATLARDKSFELKDMLASIQRLVAALIRAQSGIDIDDTHLHEIGKRLHSKVLFAYLDEVSQAVRQANTPLDETLIVENVLAGWQELFDNDNNASAR